MATSKDLLITQEEGIMIITLNRPEKLNAITLDMGESLLKILETVGQDKEVKVLIITGSGRGFCSGADVTGQEERLKWGPVEKNEWRCLNPFMKSPLLLRNLDKPVIAAVNGVAAGAGFALTLGCDIRIASENARFSMMFVKTDFPHFSIPNPLNPLPG
jgi:2-(1,2-epoxy-1,2-dihydrophenyl)acetyl-CoA isomerase